MSAQNRSMSSIGSSRSTARDMRNSGPGDLPRRRSISWWASTYRVTVSSGRSTRAGCVFGIWILVIDSTGRLPVLLGSRRRLGTGFGGGVANSVFEFIQPGLQAGDALLEEHVLFGHLPGLVERLGEFREALIESCGLLCERFGSGFLFIDFGKDSVVHLRCYGLHRFW